jgi:hypothetical protein
VATGDPDYQRPAVGECHVIPPTRFIRNDDDSLLVDCTAAHTAETILVGNMADVAPDLVDRSVPTFGGDAASYGCEEALDDYVGTADWAATRLNWVIFIPTGPQWRAGARWYRCDAYVGELGDDFKRSGVMLTGSFRDLWSGGFFDAYQACWRFDPDAPKLDYVSCAEPHDGEAVPGVIDLDAAPTDAFPGGDEILATAYECGVHVDAYLGAVREDVGWAWVGSDTAQLWANSRRNIVCFANVLNGRVTQRLRGIADADLTVIPYDEGEDDPLIVNPLGPQADT